MDDCGPFGMTGKWTTVEEASRLECLMLDISPDANLDMLFRHLENSRFSEMALGREKTKGDGLTDYIDNEQGK